MNYVHKEQWTKCAVPRGARGGHSKDENRAQLYIEDRMGIPVPEKVATRARVYGDQLLQCLFHSARLRTSSLVSPPRPWALFTIIWLQSSSPSQIAGLAGGYWYVLSLLLKL